MTTRPYYDSDRGAFLIYMMIIAHKMSDLCLPQLALTPGTSIVSRAQHVGNDQADNTRHGTLPSSDGQMPGGASWPKILGGYGPTLVSLILFWVRFPLYFMYHFIALDFISLSLLANIHIGRF